MRRLSVIADRAGSGSGFSRGRPSRRRRGRLPRSGLAFALTIPLLLPACFDEAERDRPYPAFAGDHARGAQLIRAYGCGSCHMIPGVPGADGLVGPPLDLVGRRIYVAGVLRNTPENMMFWIQNPQLVVPGNAMPDMGIDRGEARDITAYLYTLR